MNGNPQSGVASVTLIEPSDSVEFAGFDASPRVRSVECCGRALQVAEDPSFGRRARISTVFGGFRLPLRFCHAPPLYSALRPAEWLPRLLCHRAAQLRVVLNPA